jgi:hypothetical protein
MRRPSSFRADTHIALAAADSQSWERFAGSAPVFTTSIRLSIASTVRRAWMGPTAAVFPVFRTKRWETQKTIRCTRRTERNIPTSRYGSGDIGKWNTQSWQVGTVIEHR